MIYPSSNSFSLHGKTILITGASSNLGRQIAVQCAKRGANLVITGRNAERLQKTYDQLPCGEHTQVLADLTRASDRSQIIKATSLVHGLIHCASQRKFVAINDLTEQLMTEMYSINFLAPLMLTQQLLHAKHIAEKGSIIFMISTAAHTGNCGLGTYSSMQSGLIGIIKCLAMEQAAQKIRVNGISSFILDKSMKDSYKNNKSLSQDSLTDIANGAIYMLSDASRWVTGTCLVINGGAVVS